jgi:hypothetical protein
LLVRVGRERKSAELARHELVAGRRLPFLRVKKQQPLETRPLAGQSSRPRPSRELWMARKWPSSTFLKVRSPRSAAPSLPAHLSRSTRSSQEPIGRELGWNDPRSPGPAF